MTEVVQAGTSAGLDTGAVGRPRRDVAEPRLVDEELADRLLAQAAEQGVELLGEGGLLTQMTKAILERSLQVELTDHLGYEQGDRCPRDRAWSRSWAPPHRWAAVRVCSKASMFGPGTQPELGVSGRGTPSCCWRC